MKLQTFLPLATYPDANSETAIVNAVTISKLLGLTSMRWRSKRSYHPCRTFCRACFLTCPKRFTTP